MNCDNTIRKVACCIRDDDRCADGAAGTGGTDTIAISVDEEIVEWEQGREGSERIIAGHLAPQRIDQPTPLSRPI